MWVRFPPGTYNESRIEDEITLSCRRAASRSLRARIDFPHILFGFSRALWASQTERIHHCSSRYPEAEAAIRLFFGLEETLSNSIWRASPRTGIRPSVARGIRRFFYLLRSGRGRRNVGGAARGDAVG